MRTNKYMLHTRKNIFQTIVSGFTTSEVGSNAYIVFSLVQNFGHLKDNANTNFYLQNRI